MPKEIRCRALPLRPPAPQRIDASLEGLRPQQVKREAPGSQMRKIEDDIARKFEDTLSGLGLTKKTAAPAKPTVIVPPAAPRPCRRHRHRRRRRRQRR